MASGGRRILILSNFFSEGHGGTPESVLLLAGELAACGFAVDVFCDKGLLRDAQTRDALPAMDDSAAFSSAAPDTVSYAALFIAGSWNKRAPLIALRAALAGVPIVYAAKGCLCRAEFERLRDLRRIPYFLLLEWLPLALAGRIVFSSRAEQKACVLPRWLWQRRAVLLSEPFRGGEPGSATPQAGVLTLGFLAEISPRKGLFELIAGLGQYLAAQQGAAVRLKIAGPVRRGAEAYFEECQALAQSNGAAAHIEWCGPVRGAQRRDFYRSLDLFMCPSRFESFGLTPLEALWQGTAICVAPAVGLLEYIQPDAPVLRLAALGKKDIAGAITDLASNVEAWHRKGRAWEGRHALTRANAEIANDFFQTLLTATLS
jgi:glycosyltransferase involved in cell wall biosynthesis